MKETFIDIYKIILVPFAAVTAVIGIGGFRALYYGFDIKMVQIISIILAIASYVHLSLLCKPKDKLEGKKVFGLSLGSPKERSPIVWSLLLLVLISFVVYGTEGVTIGS